MHGMHETRDKERKYDESRAENKSFETRSFEHEKKETE
jgi:hypothetical protein